MSSGPTRTTTTISVPIGWPPPSAAQAQSTGTTTSNRTLQLPSSPSTTPACRTAAARPITKVISQSAAEINRQTGVKVDADPYFGISQDEIEAVIRASFHSRQMPEVLLALWAKEGSTRSVTAPLEVSQATTATNARSIFRSSV